MSMIGLYVPGSSVLHRAPAAVKLALLGAGLTLVTFLASPLTFLVSAAIVVALAGLARIGPRTLLAQVRPMAVMLAVIATAQLVLAGWRAAVMVCGSLVVAVLAAALVTLTTRTEDLLDAVVSALNPLRRLGLHPDRIGLLLALVIRTVPVLTRIITEVREARAARGAQRSVRALVVPLVIRTVRHADRLGEALIARGADD